METRDKIVEALLHPEEFEDFEIELQGLLYIDNYVEEKGRFMMTDGIGDVILRYQVGEVLHAASLLPSSNPFNVPQMKLLELLEELGSWHAS